MRSRSRRRIAVVLTALAAVYVAGSAVFRATHTEVWERDGRAYVIFPAGQRLVYLAFRPLSYLDGALTGTGSRLFGSSGFPTPHLARHPHSRDDNMQTLAPMERSF